MQTVAICVYFMSASLKDIAQQANVSIATASRALRNRKEIAPETRARVQQIAQRLRYRPNQLARSILTGKTKTVGVIFPRGAQRVDFCLQILLGIHIELGQADYHAICLWSDDNDSFNTDQHIAAQIHSLIDKRVDGFIVNPSIDARETYIREIAERQLPMVLVDIDLPGSNCDFVGTDDFTGAYKATEYLLRLGHRRILHIHGPASSSTALGRKEAFIKANKDIDNSDYTLAEDPLFGADPYGSLLIAQTALRAEPKPTAIFCANDYIAAAVYKAARREGLRIPDDLSVVGFADIEFCELLDPPLTTIKQDPFEIGRAAATLCIERINDAENQTQNRKILLKPELIFRQSAAPNRSRA